MRKSAVSGVDDLKIGVASGRVLLYLACQNREHQDLYRSARGIPERPRDTVRICDLLGSAEIVRWWAISLQLRFVAGLQPKSMLIQFLRR
jgi:hypothetical protein